MNATPAVPRLFAICLTASPMIWLAEPGASLLRLSSSGWVAECPTSPRIDTSTISAGNSASTP